MTLHWPKKPVTLVTHKAIVRRFLRTKEIEFRVDVMLELLSQIFKSTDCTCYWSGVLKVRTYKSGKLQAMFTQSPNYIYTNSTPGIIKYRSIRWTNLRAVGREITNRSCQSKCPTALFLFKRPLWQALGLCNFVQTTALREAWLIVESPYSEDQN